MYISKSLFSYWSAEIVIVKCDNCAYGRNAKYTSNFSTTANNTSLLFLIKALRHCYVQRISPTEKRGIIKMTPKIARKQAFSTSRDLEVHLLWNISFH